MDTHATDLVAEMKALRKGRGVHVNHIDERIGPALRVACGVTDRDNSTEIRQKVVTLLQSIAAELPNDLRVAVLAAFALGDDIRTPFYQERVRWAAAQLNRDERTARRRIDEGIDQLAELLAGSAPGGRDPTTVRDPIESWHTDELRVALALDRPEPEAFELRRVVADRDGLDELDLALASPTGCIHPAELAELHVDVFYGGRLVRRTKESADRFGFVLGLSKTLQRNEKHEFLLRFRVPHRRVIQPHYVCVPKNRCNLFDLHVRFGQDTAPLQVWRLTDWFQQDIDDPVRAGTEIPVDSAGEVHARFRDLAPGLAYGIRWSAHPAPAPSDGAGPAGS